MMRARLVTLLAPGTAISTSGALSGGPTATVVPCGCHAHGDRLMPLAFHLTARDPGPPGAARAHPSRAALDAVPEPWEARGAGLGPGARPGGRSAAAKTASPAKINPLPNSAPTPIRSPNSTTPRMPAVKGSARDKVVAVAAGTACRPRPNSKYAPAVATRPRCRAAPRPRGSSSQPHRVQNVAGTNNKAPPKKATATVASGGTVDSRRLLATV